MTVDVMFLNEMTLTNVLNTALYFEPPMNRKYTETLAVVDNIVRKVYRLVQYLTIFNRMSQN
jgi:hypothetical protein